MKQRLPATLGAFIAISTLAHSTTAVADEPAAVHRFVDDKLPPPRARGKVLLAGTLITGLFYLPVLGASYIWPDQRGASDLRIPVVGPWMTLGQTRLCNADPNADADCNNFLRVTGAVLLAFDGLGQAGGVAVMLQSLFMRTGSGSAEQASESPSEFSALSSLPQRPPNRPLTYRSGDFEMTPVPMVGAGSDLGLAFIGQF
jgi:hypothetical protein